MDNKLEKAKERIRMFLRKAESTTFEEERKTFLEAAEKMMMRLGLERAELEANGEAQAEPIVRKSVILKGNYSGIMVEFFSCMAYGYGDLFSYQIRYRGRLDRDAVVMGTESDTEQFLELFQSVHTQALAALHRWQKETRGERFFMTDMEKFNLNRSFLKGFGEEVGSRLFSIRMEQSGMASKGAELVLASKQARIQEEVDKMTLRTAQSAMRGRNPYAELMGREAGRDADIGGKKIKG